MIGLPRGWHVASLSDICDRIVDGSHNPPKGVDIGRPMLSARNIQDRRINFGEYRLISEADFQVEHQRTAVRAGDVLMTIVGTIGRTAVVGDHVSPFALQRSVAVLRAPSFDSQYLSYALESPLVQKILGDSAQGTAQKGVYLKTLGSIAVPLAPLPEQKRIADKLDTVLARVDACRDRLDRIPALLKRFRQSILAAATSGRLTEDWRATNPGQDNQAELEVSAKEIKRTAGVKVRGASIQVEAELLHPLPPSWAWIENHRLAAADSNAICAGPFGTIFKAKDFRDSGVPIIFLRHVGAGEYRTHKPNFMDSAVWKEHHQPYSVFGGELLVTKLGDPPGDACIYPAGIGTAMVTPDVMKMTVDQDVARTEYLMHYFNSPTSKKITESVCFGVTRLRIDLSLFKTFPIPTPPRAEQHEIVRRVETLFAFADRLEARLATARKQAGQLTPALLAKAFRGELVPQDPNDEPATELLKRLATQRDAAPKPKRGRKAASA
ncbi:restriction endonuclease subunit S [Niveibacterium sp. COAC-50]|uniref:restriction endonuclease subunit S n=1 Tax=Niveibacterium sp. COAC-50 TaxID=2729384 RepID=UPI001553C74F|nr:restriction endonuclease subunit S [Niveibacterium sp. COAC-50]